jgi:hypothetical protein
VATRPPALTLGYTDFLVRLRMYCAEARASVTSYGRTVKHNEAVGGVATSLHLRWLAADVVYDEPVEMARCQALAALHGLQVLREADHDHVSPAGGPH